MIPTYNQTEYLEKALKSVLEQDPGPREMQIEVVDDASTAGDAEATVQRVGAGRVVFFRQARNLGIMANWNSCVERSVGQWVHILHSDDIVLPGFYERLRSALIDHEEVGAAFCRHAFIQENDRWIGVSELERSTPGILQDFIEKIGVSQRLQCPAITVRRTVYEKLGGFRGDLPYAGDWEMWQRIAVNYPFWYDPTIMAAFRVHSQSYTQVLMRSGETIADSRRCIAVSRPLLPPDRAEDISRQAREVLAAQALEHAFACAKRLAFASAVQHVWQGLTCNDPLGVIKALLLLPPRRRARRRVQAAARKQFAGD
jgi:glycosyltransferase involved in cell wall biosynthesis